MRDLAVVLLPAAVVAATLLATAPAERADLRPVALNQARAQIRSLPILERPNRPIHIYGNAVRRRHHRATMAEPIRPDR